MEILTPVDLKPIKYRNQNCGLNDYIVDHFNHANFCEIQSNAAHIVKI